MKRTTIFSGIQPSGMPHLGNLIGMIRPSVALQGEGKELILMIADLHAITLPQDPKALKENAFDIVAWFLAVGLDPKQSHIFIQSENPDHPYLTWVLNCFTKMGELERMTQFKDKAKRLGTALDRANVGLFAYPVLQAVDILLYDSDLVPVGEDQVQHIELTRDIAKRFNRRYGEVFRLPKALVDRQAKRIMSLSNPAAKMSKSVSDPGGTVNLLDTRDQIVKKITRAVTDSGSEIVFDPVGKPAVSNLLVIYSAGSGKNISDLEHHYRGKKSYVDFKKDLSEIVLQTIMPIQERYKTLRKDEAYLSQVLDQGLAFVREKSTAKVALVRGALGLGRL